ncbi:MAG: amino acid adenylation domain-containing protein, partial [Anaerohalosphaeraceae bacterium]
MQTINDKMLWQFIQAVNDTAVDYPKDKCIHQLFEQQAEKTPDATAVVFEDQTLTYAQLNEQANQLAHYLRANGVGPDVPVGVCMERSFELMVTLLGILKAGGAYVPLDPKYPPERLSHMIRETGMPAILTQQRFQTLDFGSCRNVIAIDSQWDQISSVPQTSSPPEVSLKPPHAAYILFTSGSTGLPKGVVVEHGAILNSFLWLQETFSLGPQDRILQKTTFTFDVSLWDLLWPLTAGAQVILASPGKHIDMDYLVEAIRSHQITVINFVPSVLELFLSHPEVSQCTSLRLVLAAGEALSYPLLARFFELLNAELHNLYGPTEAAIQVTWWPCCKDNPHQIVPIGKPIANTQAYILDNSLQPVPIGMPGDLYIGGVQLARGYLARPELTAERFMPDPFSSQPGARIYKTGDVCRWMEDGNIDYLGRADDQVKIRGFRIELGEIENALRTHPAVAQAAVKVHENQPGLKMLAGYYVCKQRHVVSTDEIMAYLRQRLPDYMVPAGIMELDQIPLTASGKTNRKALPALEAIHANSSSQPQTPTEQALARIWIELLGVKDIYREDNFFHLGGHSLKAIQTVYHIQNKFKINLPVSTLFENPTLEQFAQIIDQYGAKSYNNDLQIPTVSRDKTYPLSFAQKRMWFIQQLSPELPVYNISWMIYMKGHLDIQALEKSLKEIIRRHESFRTTFPMNDGQPVQYIQPEISWNLPVETIASDSLSPINTFQTIAETRAQAVFNLEQGPLFHLTLLCMKPDHHALLVNIHHLITDGWSLGIFAQELSGIYQHFIQGTPVDLAKLPVQYVDYGCWQQVEIETIKKQDFEYWKDKLAGDIHEVTIPTDYPRTTISTYLGQWETTHIDDAVYAELKDLSHKQNTTLYTILMSVFNILLYLYTRIEDITVGSPISGRTHKNIEKIIGFFVNTTVLRTSITRNMSFLDVLRQVRQLCLEAQEHQNLPYDVLVELLKPPRQANKNLYFQTMLAYQDSHYWTVNLPNLNCQTVEISTKTSKLDFTLFCDESHSGLHLRAEYNTDLYKSATIRAVLQTYESLLATVVSHPDILISELLHQNRFMSPAGTDSAYSLQGPT